LVLAPVLDFVWFGLVASNLYKKELGGLLRMKDGSIKPEILPAILVYFLIAALTTFFVVPKIGAGGILPAFLWGALAGLILYGVYDLTNLSFLKDWTITTSIVDIIWGAFMCGVLGVVATYLKVIFSK
jgi:uncharacterized membrane protein